MHRVEELTPPKNLKGALKLPPDKSISHRAAMFAALHEGSSEIKNFSRAADPQSTLSCLEQLGVPVRRVDGRIIVEGVGRHGFKDPEQPLNCCNSGTTMRLLSGIVGGAGINCTLIGDESLSARTMKRIINPLRAMNINITGRDENFSPLQIKGGNPVKALEFELPIASAQLKSCVLLAGLFGEEWTRVMETTPSRDHTERLLNLPVDKKEKTTVISSNSSVEVPEQSYRIPNDFSAAAFWLVAGSIHPQAVITLEGVGVNPSRTAALQILQQMGANIDVKNRKTEGAEPVADLSVSSSVLKPVEISEELVPNCIDEIPVLAIAMLFADGISRIRGAKELRHKETDRLSALVDIMKRSGAKFSEYDDGLEIHGNPDFKPSPAVYDSYHDHRIAMSAAVLTIMSSGTSKVTGAGCTDISYPGFWSDLSILTN